MGIIQETEGKALKAGIWYVISSICIKTVSIITTPLFTRLMTTSEYGVVGNFTAWVSLLTVLCTFQLTFSVGRAKLDYPNQLDEFIGSVQLLTLMTTGAAVIIAIIFLEPLSRLFSLTGAETVLLLVYLLAFPSIELYQNGARYRYRYKENIGIAIFIAVSTVALALLLFFTIDTDRALLRIIGITAPVAFLSSVLWVRSLRHRFIKINAEFWKYGLILSLPLVLHTVSLNILAQSDRIFIAKICGSGDAGIYTLVYNYGILITVVTGAVVNGWLPWFHDTYYAGNYTLIREKEQRQSYS